MVIKALNIKPFSRIELRFDFDRKLTRNLSLLDL